MIANLIQAVIFPPLPGRSPQFLRFPLHSFSGTNRLASSSSFLAISCRFQGGSAWIFFSSRSLRRCSSAATLARSAAFRAIICRFQAGMVLPAASVSGIWNRWRNWAERDGSSSQQHSSNAHFTDSSGQFTHVRSSPEIRMPGNYSETTVHVANESAKEASQTWHHGVRKPSLLVAVIEKLIDWDDRG